VAQTYIVLAPIGTAAPYAKFIPRLIDHGLNLRLFFAELAQKSNQRPQPS